MANRPTTGKPVQHQIATPAEAQAIATHLNEVMDGLLKLVEHETGLVRDGKIGEASRLEATKAKLAQLYVADAMAIRANAPFLKTCNPALMRSLRERHDLFHSLLQINLTVLATAHAVAESVVRGVSTEITRKSAPQTYGASGRQAAPGPRQSLPLAMSRNL